MILREPPLPPLYFEALFSTFYIHQAGKAECLKVLAIPAWNLRLRLEPWEGSRVRAQTFLAFGLDRWRALHSQTYQQGRSSWRVQIRPRAQIPALLPLALHGHL